MGVSSFSPQPWVANPSGVLSSRMEGIPHALPRLLPLAGFLKFVLASFSEGLSGRDRSPR